LPATSLSRCAAARHFAKSQTLPEKRISTLGIITEVTLRLYALPQVDRSFAIELRGTEHEVSALLGAIMTSPLGPFAFLIVNRNVARTLGLGEAPAALLRLGGNEAVVGDQLDGISRIAEVREIEQDVWTSLRQLEGDAHTAIRVSSLPRRFVATAARILNDDIGGIYTNIDLRRGVMRIVVAGDDGGGVSSADGVVDLSSDSSDATSIVFEKLPADLWSKVSPSVVADSLSRRIKKAYDPHNILNPGILGD
jgi:FAD/FMN-containing dehydrogenase